MSYSPALGSAFNDTRVRSERLCAPSGMCSLCSGDCVGPCEIGLSAVLGAQTVYPTNTGNNQVASEKVYPLDYSHFNINGRVFGAQGAAADSEQATVFNVDLTQSVGTLHPVKLALPLHLPALIKLNWKDYFGGAAMAGVSCVIGEGAPSKDAKLHLAHGKIAEFPMLADMLDAFRRYDRGYGQIILQCNCEDDAQGLPEYAICKHGATAIEFKFGQSAKGTQPVNFIPDLESALKKQAAGALVHPDPSDAAVQRAYEQGVCPNFYAYSRLPMWDEGNLPARIETLRQIGLKNVYFKMTGYDPADIERVLRIAAAAQVDMVTFDGAGGGSGYSPCKMMNEWGLPTVTLEAVVRDICVRLSGEGLALPKLCITGGFSTEDQIYKALALGAPYFTTVGLGRAAMAAATSAKNVGELIAAGKTPAHLQKYGSTVRELFRDLPELRALYGKEADGFSTGAIGVFSYLNRVGFGLRHFAALNRKFALGLIDQSDLIPLSAEAAALLR